MRIGIFFFLLFIAHFVKSQDITGIWRGHFRSNEIYQRLTGEDDRYKMEVQIAQENKNFKAVTYSYKSTVFYGKADAKGTVDFNSKKVVLKELKITEVRMMYGVPCTMTCYMQYVRLGDDEFLQGTYTSNSTKDSADCGSGTISLHKVASSDFHKEPFLEKKEEENATKKITPKPDTAATKNTAPPKSAPVASAKKTAPAAKPVTKPKTSPTMAKSAAKPPVIVPKTNGNKSTTSKTTKPQEKSLTKKNLEQHQIVTINKDTIQAIDKKVIPVPIPAELSGRSNELVKTITVNTQDVQLYIYDDGVVDNDTVSVYFDNKLIVHNARLTTQAIIAKIHLDESSPTHEVVMVAENLGEIPPNTSLMVVKAGEQRYEVRIVSTEQQNAVIRFKYEKKAE
jgi:hypothetical protein